MPFFNATLQENVLFPKDSVSRAAVIKEIRIIATEKEKHNTCKTMYSFMKTNKLIVVLTIAVNSG